MSTAHVFNTESPDSPPLLVRIPAAAHLRSVGRSTIYELIWRGELVRDGTAWNPSGRSFGPGTSGDLRPL